MFSAEELRGSNKESLIFLSLQLTCFFFFFTTETVKKLANITSYYHLLYYSAALILFVQENVISYKHGTFKWINTLGSSPVIIFITHSCRDGTLRCG